MYVPDGFLIERQISGIYNYVNVSSLSAQERRMIRTMQQVPNPVRNMVLRRSPPSPLQLPVRVKTQTTRPTASSPHQPFSTKAPAEIAASTPPSLIHQSVTSKQTVSSTPLSASRTTRTAAPSHLPVIMLHTLNSTTHHVNERCHVAQGTSVYCRRTRF